MEMTPFDLAVSNRNMIMLKALLPFIPGNRGKKILSIYIKAEELMNTMRYVNTDPDICPETEPDTSDILNSLKKYMSTGDRENIDAALNMINIIQMMQSMSDSDEDEDEEDDNNDKEDEDDEDDNETDDRCQNNAEYQTDED